MSAEQPLGWIAPEDRTPEQQRAHEDIMNAAPRFALARPTVPKGTKIILTSFLGRPEVIQNIGEEFTGFRQLTGSCFPAGTPVRMADGSERPIEDIQVGDVVVTHRQRQRSVSQIMSRSYSGQMVSIQASGYPFPLEMTADHQVAVRDGDGILWKCAEDLVEGDFIFIGWDRTQAEQVIDCLPLLGPEGMSLDELMKENAFTKGNNPEVPNSNYSSARSIVRHNGTSWKGKVRLKKSRVENSILRYIPVCPSLARLIGIYLAEGGNHEGRVTFTFHRKESETLAVEVLSLVRGLFGVEGELRLKDSRPNTCTVRFQNTNLAAVFAGIAPGNVYSKRVPAIFFQANEETRLAVLLGWMAGDGYVGEQSRDNTVRITGVTCCAELARDMTTLALSCGLKATCTTRKARKQSQRSYAVDLAGKKAVSLFPAVAHRAEGRRYSNSDPKRSQYGYARIVRNITTRQVESLQVFDFEVMEDHSFIAGGIVVHNCVGVSEGNAVSTLSAIQRCIADSPTKAMIPWWGFPYGRSRFKSGMRTRGEGSITSIMGAILRDEGCFAINEEGFRTAIAFTKSDGWAVPSSVELQWSDGDETLVTQYLGLAKQFPVGSVSPCNSIDDVIAGILNGYPCLNGCNYYMGSGHLNNAGIAIGSYNGRGGHATTYEGYWEHETLGPLVLYRNQWSNSTYPQDSTGKPRCSVWAPESEANRLFQLGGNNGETMILSHLNYHPVQVDKILSYASF